MICANCGGIYIGKVVNLDDLCSCVTPAHQPADSGEDTEKNIKVRQHLSDEDKALLRDFIANVKPPDSSDAKPADDLIEQAREYLRGYNEFEAREAEYIATDMAIFARQAIAADRIKRVEENKSMKNGIDLIAEERQRQIDVEGWTPDHDAARADGQLGDAAMCYIGTTLNEFTEYSSELSTVPYAWPWAEKWWKPSDPIRNLVKAGALIAAEIDRIKRQV